MKTLKSMLTGIALLFICIAANATVKSTAGKPTKEDVIKTYVDAITNAKINNLDKVLDDNLQFNMQRGENVTTLSKGQLLDYLKNSATADPSVTTTTTMLQDDDNSAFIKVEFKYADYVRTDEITLSNANGWVISKVQSSFK